MNRQQIFLEKSLYISVKGCIQASFFSNITAVMCDHNKNNQDNQPSHSLKHKKQNKTDVTIPRDLT